MQMLVALSVALALVVLAPTLGSAEEAASDWEVLKSATVADDGAAVSAALSADGSGNLLHDGIDKYGMTALHYAAKEGSAEAMAVLIEASAKVDQTDKYGKTPLMMCAPAPPRPLM